MSQRLTAKVGNHAQEPPQIDAKSFQAKLHAAITRGLSEVLGDAGAKATSFHLGLTPTSTAAAVHDGLVKIFGSGTQALELSILRELYSAVGSKFEPEESKTFVGYVTEAKRVRPRKKEG